jgi:hypothetical protein
MKFLKAIISVLIISIIFFVISCSDNVITNPEDVVFPDTDVSFLNHVQPVIIYNCSPQGCHSDNTAAAGLRLTDYLSYFDSGVALGLVVAGKPDNSRLIQIIEKPEYHMPFLYWSFNNNHKSGIRKWISEGAKNN